MRHHLHGPINGGVIPGAVGGTRSGRVVRVSRQTMPSNVSYITISRLIVLILRLLFFPLLILVLFLVSRLVSQVEAPFLLRLVPAAVVSLRLLLFRRLTNVSAIL